MAARTPVLRLYHRRARTLLPAALLAASLLGLTTSACKPTPPPAHRVVMVGIDGGDWRVLDPFIDAGVAPSLAVMRRDGASASLRVDSAQSPESWTSIASGRHPEEHGVIEKNSGLPGGGFGASNADVKVHRIWDMATRQGRSSLVLDYWAAAPAYPILGVLIPRRRGTSWPPGLNGGASDVQPTHHAQLVASLGLGSLDSGWARQLLAQQSFDLAILPYYGVDQGLHLLFREYMTAQEPKAMAALPQATADRMQLGYEIVEETVRLADGWVELALQYAGPDGYVVLFSDHGHAASPPVRRVAVGRQVLDGSPGSIEHGSLDLSKLGFGPVQATLDPVARRRQGEELRVTSVHLSGDGAQAAMDALLTRTTKAGDLAFEQAGDLVLRPSAAVVKACQGVLGRYEEPAWSCFVNSGGHGVKDLGIFAVHGPDVRPGRLPQPVDSVAITPTVLWLMGLPTGQDLAAQPLTQVLSTPRPVTTIPSYEDGTMPWRKGTQDAPTDDVELQEWLKSMGYME